MGRANDIYSRIMIKRSSPTLVNTAVKQNYTVVQ
jgi:hypothetical protein